MLQQAAHPSLLTAVMWFIPSSINQMVDNSSIILTSQLTIKDEVLHNSSKKISTTTLFPSLMKRTKERGSSTRSLGNTGYIYINITSTSAGNIPSICSTYAISSKLELGDISRIKPGDIYQLVARARHTTTYLWTCY